jgi:hypothetical protein
VADFVLVHGSTQSPAGWNRLAGALSTRGHRVTAIDLPVDQPEWTVADYARGAAAQAGEPGGRRVVVGHSGAGVLLPAIAQAAGASAVVWLAAYVPDLAGGHSMAEDIRAHRPPVTGPCGPNGCARRRASAWPPSQSRSTRATARTSPSPRQSPTSCLRPELTGQTLAAEALSQPALRKDFGNPLARRGAGPANSAGDTLPLRRRSPGYQRPWWTTSVRGRRLGVVMGRSGRSAG